MEPRSTSASGRFINGGTTQILQRLHLHRGHRLCSRNHQSGAEQYADLGFDHLHLECGLRWRNYLLSLGGHIARHCQSGQRRAAVRHKRHRQSAHQRSHHLRAALDVHKRRCNPALNDYTYTEFALTAGAITSPTPSSTLTSASTTFTWSAGSGSAVTYYLWVGTSPGTANLVNIGPLSGTSATVTLPTNGATIYVRLWTFINGGATQLYNDYTYTEASVGAGAITSPSPGTTLPGASTTFNWSAGSGGAITYYLWVGSSPGTADLINMGPISGTSATVNLPTNGVPVYVRLWTFINGGTTQLSNDYTYTEAGP